MDEELVASHLDAIYGVAREGFVAERDRRVKELRSAGHRDEAGALAAQRKPTVPAWAVDRLARERSAEVERLISAGQQLRDAQRRASSGRGSDGLREASRAVRSLLSELRDHAGGIIDEAGASPASHLDEVQQTLFAAAVDPDHHEGLRRGWFARPLEGVGFGGATGLAVVPDAGEDGADREDAQGETDGGEPSVDGNHQAEEAARREAEAAERREAEQREAERAARRAELTRQQADLRRSRERQQRRVDRATSEADDLERRATAARSDAAHEHEELSRIDEDLTALDHELSELAD